MKPDQSYRTWGAKTPPEWTETVGVNHLYQ